MPASTEYGDWLMVLMSLVLALAAGWLCYPVVCSTPSVGNSWDTLAFGLSDMVTGKIEKDAALAREKAIAFEQASKAQVKASTRRMTTATSTLSKDVLNPSQHSITILNETKAGAKPTALTGAANSPPGTAEAQLVTKRSLGRSTTSSALQMMVEHEKDRLLSHYAREHHLSAVLIQAVWRTQDWQKSFDIRMRESHRLTHEVIRFAQKTVFGVEGTKIRIGVVRGVAADPINVRVVQKEPSSSNKAHFEIDDPHLHLRHGEHCGTISVNLPRVKDETMDAGRVWRPVRSFELYLEECDSSGQPLHARGSCSIDISDSNRWPSGESLSSKPQPILYWDYVKLMVLSNMKTELLWALGYSVRAVDSTIIGPLILQFLITRALTDFDMNEAVWLATIKLFCKIAVHYTTYWYYLRTLSPAPLLTTLQVVEHSCRAHITDLLVG
jgi:hypothetical protein